MPKPYRAVPLPGRETRVKFAAVRSESDFDALDRAKQLLGVNIPFDLWNGGKLVLSYRPDQRADLSVRDEEGPS